VKRNRNGRPRKDLALLALAGARRSLRRRVAEAEATLELLKPADRAASKQEAEWRAFEKRGELLHREQEAAYRLCHGKAQPGDREIYEAWLKRCEADRRRVLAQYKRRQSVSITKAPELEPDTHHDDPDDRARWLQ